jgi:hypothetical protein
MIMKRKEVKEDPNLVANERFECLGGEWKVPMFGGPWKEKKKHIFHLFSLPP